MRARIDKLEDGMGFVSFWSNGQEWSSAVHSARILRRQACAEIALRQTR
jgi:hypothetical protein